VPAPRQDHWSCTAVAGAGWSRHADDTVSTEADDWITTRYEQVPPADADAHAVTSRIVEQW